MKKVISWIWNTLKFCVKVLCGWIAVALIGVAEFLLYISVDMAFLSVIQDMLDNTEKEILNLAKNN